MPQSRNQRRLGAIERLERALNNMSSGSSDHPELRARRRAECAKLRTRIEEIERNIANDPNGSTHGGKSVTAFKPIKPIGLYDPVRCHICTKSPPRWMYLERGIIDDNRGSLHWYCPDCTAVLNQNREFLKEHTATRLAS